METRSRARSSKRSEADAFGGSTGSLNIERFTPFGPPLPARVRNLAATRAYSLDRSQTTEQVQVDSQQSTPAVSESLLWDGLGLPSGHEAAASNVELLSHHPTDQLQGGGGASLASEGIDDFDGMRYITPRVLSDELSRMTRTIETSILRSQESIMASIPRFITAAESRIEKSVIEKVSSEYNRIGIACVEDRTRTRTAFSEVRTRVNEGAEATLALNHRLAELSTCTVQRLDTTDAAIGILRSDLNQVRSTMAEAPAAVTLAELNESIRALSLRLGAFESSRPGVGSVNAGMSQQAPDLPTDVSDPTGDPLRNQGGACPRDRHPAPVQGVRNPPLARPLSPAGQSEHHSGETSYLGDWQAQLDRVKRKSQVTADLIRAIIRRDLSGNLAKNEVLEIVNYDMRKLEELKKTFSQLEQKWERLHDAEPTTGDLFDNVNYEVIAWEHALLDLKRKHYMHLTPNNSLLRNVQLSPFTGSPDAETVYQFLDTFHRLSSAGCSPMEQADLLYTNYLTPDIQAEVFSFKGDLARVEAWLISQHGDLRTIVDSRMHSITTMKHPSSGQSYKVKADYYKGVMQLILHIESLLSNDRVDSGEIASIVHNSSFVTRLVSALPEDVFMRFTRLIEKEPRVPPPSGKRYFEIMRDLIDSTWRQLYSANKIRVATDSVKAAVPAAPTEPRKRNRAAHVSGSSALSGASPFQCPLHDGKSKHDLGQCHVFFKGTNAQRLEACKLHRMCFSCFKPECIKVSPRACITSNVPADLICQTCKQATTRRTFSVLLCTNQSHSKPSLKQVQDALSVYFKNFDIKLMDHLKGQFNLMFTAGRAKPKVQANRAQPESKSSAVRPLEPTPVFDTANGQSIAAPKLIRTESSEDTVYVFQLIQVKGETGLVFYDSGATSNLVLGPFAERAGFKVLSRDNQLISALGDTTLWTEYGMYSAVLGSEESGLFYHLTFQGIGQITSKFPRYEWASITSEVRREGKLDSSEPLPQYVGGRQVDILLGLKSPELLPRLLFTLPSGLGVYRCQFRDIFGSRIAFGGPHEVVSRIHRQFHQFSVNKVTVLLNQLASSYRESPWIGIDLSPPVKAQPLTIRPTDLQSVRFETTPLSGFDLGHCQSTSEAEPLVLGPGSPCLSQDISERPMRSRAMRARVSRTGTTDDSSIPLPPDEGSAEPNVGSHVMSNPSVVECSPCVAKAKMPLAKLKQIMEDDREPIVSYRCPNCEDCPDCRSSPTLQTTSLRARTEQKLIEASVRIDYEQARVYVKLPFMQDPVQFFKSHFGSSGSNFGQARLTFLQQCRKQEVIKDGIRSEMSKLLEAGFIRPLSDLPAETRALIDTASVKHYFPWRSVSKPDSVSTPTRLVVDPSMSLLNLILAKGDPQLSSMFSILLRSRSAPCLWSADVKKLYNMLYLEDECLPYSLFLYNPSLNVTEEPQVFVLLRAWYGVASTGGQATYALRKLGSDHASSHPLGSRVLLSESYVDDLLSATQSRPESDEQAKQVNEILSRGGMSLKFVAHSGELPPELASADVDAMSILGYRYLPEPDKLMLNLGEINFNKKARGAKAPNVEPCVSPQDVENLIHSLPKLTRRHVVAKAAELFDPLGMFEPFKAHLKRALSALNTLEWNDEIPDSEHQFWVDNLKLWPDLGRLEAPRTVVPVDAVTPTQVRLICNTDASQTCGGACVYLSFKLRSGKWSSQLLTAKSRLMSFSVPRNELDAILLGMELTFAVIVSLRLPFLHVLIASDSLVAVSWAMNDRARNKTFVYNRVLAVNRYIRWIKENLPMQSEVELVHIKGVDNAADCLTKGAVHPRDIDLSSPWQVGLPWMAEDVKNMPLTRYADISLSRDDAMRFLEETIATDLIVCPPRVEDIGDTSFCLYPTVSCGVEITACVVCPPRSACSSPTPKSFLSCSSVSPEGARSLMKEEDNEFKQFGGATCHLIDVVYFGWKRSNRILAIVTEFGLRLFHNTHLHTRSEPVRRSMAARCLFCLMKSHLLGTTNQDINVTHADVIDDQPTAALDPSLQMDMASRSCDRQAVNSSVQLIVNFYWDYRATLLCKARLEGKELTHFEEDPNNGILFYKGRFGPEAKISVRDLDLLNLDFLDGKEINFCNPCIMPDCSIFYAYSLHVHLVMLPHSGLESTLQEISKRFYPIRPRKILTRLLSSCIKCRILQKKVLAHEMEEHKAVRTTLAPPFSFFMCDLAQNFLVKTRFVGRQTMKAPALVCCCLLSGATAIYMLEDWSVSSVVQAIERHSCRYGVPSQIFIDAGSQLRKLSTAVYSIVDLSNSVRNRFACEVVQAPPKSHSSQGRVERRIGLIKDMLEKMSSHTGMLLSFLNWETLFGKIANDLNNLPIARPSSTSQVRPEWGIVTPNRLLLGRNNKRSLSGPLILDPCPSNVLARLNAAQEEWYKLFLKQLHLFIPRPKWYNTDDVSVDDIVLFFIEESSMKKRSMHWHYGVVAAIDGQKLTIEYTLPPSATRKSVQRSKRDVVRICSEDELDFNSESHFRRLTTNSLAKK